MGILIWKKKLMSTQILKGSSLVLSLPTKMSQLTDSF